MSCNLIRIGKLIPIWQHRNTVLQQVDNIKQVGCISTR